MKKLIAILFILALLCPWPCPAAQYVPVYNSVMGGSFKTLCKSPNEGWISISKRDLTSSPDAFRIFLPPGMVYANVNIYTFNDSRHLGFAVSYQHPSACVYCKYAGQPAHYDDVPWVHSPSLRTVSQEGDVYVPVVNQGLAKIVTFSSTMPMSENEAGWLYIKKVPFTSATIRDIVIDLRVDPETYLNWYNNYTGWDSSGNPASGNNTVAVVAPAPATSGGTSSITNATGDSSSPGPDIVSILLGGNEQPQEDEVKTETFTTIINEVAIFITLKAGVAVITIGGVDYRYKYTDKDCLVTIYDSGQIPLLELSRYKGGLVVVPSVKIMLEGR